METRKTSVNGSFDMSRIFNFENKYIPGKENILGLEPIKCECPIRRRLPLWTVQHTLYPNFCGTYHYRWIGDIRHDEIILNAPPNDSGAYAGYRSGGGFGSGYLISSENGDGGSVLDVDRIW